MHKYKVIDQPYLSSLTNTQTRDNLIYLVYLDLLKHHDLKQTQWQNVLFYSINTGISLQNINTLKLNKKQMKQFNTYLKQYQFLSNASILLKVTNTYTWFSNYHPFTKTLINNINLANKFYQAYTD